MFAAFKGHLNRLLGRLKLALGKVLRSERLLAKGASQNYIGEQQLEEARDKPNRWLRRRKS